MLITSEEIKRRLWSGANELRGSMDAARYKDYMLGLMFYKFLSDKTLETFANLSNLRGASEAQLFEAYESAKEKYGNRIETTIQDQLGYYVPPEYLYQAWIRDLNNGEFEVQKVSESLNRFESLNVKGQKVFQGLFSGSTLDLKDTGLGSSLNERNKNISALVELFADLNMAKLQKGDVLGNAYEYLIGMFAMDSGKKAGEFYTPHQVSEVMAHIVTKSSKISSIYDPTVGSRVIIMITANSNDGYWVSEFLQENKIIKMEDFYVRCS